MNPRLVVAAAAILAYAAAVTGGAWLIASEPWNSVEQTVPTPSATPSPSTTTSPFDVAYIAALTQANSLIPTDQAREYTTLILDRDKTVIQDQRLVFNPDGSTEAVFKHWGGDIDRVRCVVNPDRVCYFKMAEDKKWWVADRPVTFNDSVFDPAKPFAPELGGMTFTATDGTFERYRESEDYRVTVTAHGPVLSRTERSKDGASTVVYGQRPIPATAVQPPPKEKTRKHSVT